MMGRMSAEAWGPKRITETTSAYDAGAMGARSGLMTGTRVATAIGWRAVEGLQAGDLVLTFDAGLQPVTKVTREVIWQGVGNCPRGFWPLHVPAGALGNRDALCILSQQYVMVESDAGEDLFGDPFSLITAQALEGVNGIAKGPPPRGMEAVVLHFENEQVVFAECGVLYYCPSAAGLMQELVDTRAQPPYKALSEGDADILIMCIESERAVDRIWASSETSSPFYAMA